MEWPNAKKALLKKKWNQNDQPRPPAFDRLKSFDYNDFTVKHCDSRCSKSPDVDGIKILEKDNQATKH